VTSGVSRPIAEASGQLRQLFANGLDNEGDGPAVAGMDGRRIDDGDEGAGGTWPRPVHDRKWVDDDGIVWRMRGGPLDAKQARRLMKRQAVHVVRAYEVSVAEVRGAERDALLARVEEFFAGNAPPYSKFELGDFRDQNHRATLIVQESC
jgi:hypothetical protein